MINDGYIRFKLKQIMKLMLVVTLALVILCSKTAFGEKGSFVDKVEFIQYSDENTALQEVKNGNLDIYYQSVSSDILDPKTRQDLNVFQSTGSEYSLLINPAPSEHFNPFSIKQVRFALNYLVDRDLIVNEIMGGYGAPMICAFKPYDPDYLLILGELQSFNFRYNPAYAEQIISNELTKAGAQYVEGKWYYSSKPIEITIFIRSDDPIRESIGEILASQLEKTGFVVKKDYGDLTKAFSVVYGSNPSDMKWNIYTEGYTTSAFVRYDSVITAQMYSPWFSNMPGFNNPAYWNYKDDYMDSLSKSILLGNFTSSDERAGLIKKAVHEGVQESVRIFLAVKKDQFVANKKVEGIINDFGAGITSRFTPINAHDNSSLITVGVKKIYQGAWNPIAGFSDSSSQQVWGSVFDPGDFKNPYTGLTFPLRTTWEVQTAGPKGKLEVPSDAIKWSPSQQKWVEVGTGKKSTSKVTFHLKFSDWHNKQPMDMNDVLYGIYFMYQWGSDQAAGSKTFDSDFSPKANQAANTTIGVRVLDRNTIEVYLNYWHFDSGEIADSAQIWPSMPWEMIYSMEKAVTDGKLAFSRTDAVSNNVDWLSLLVPEDASIIKTNLEEFKNNDTIPAALEGMANSSYCDARYGSSASWISEHNHAVISNGPFYVDNYSPEARVITIKAFDDSTYPFGPGYWREFEEVKLPKIETITTPDTVLIGKDLNLTISVTPGSTVYYYFINGIGRIVDEGQQESDSGRMDISIPAQKTMNFTLGANDLQVFTISNSAYRPDVFHTSFLAVENNYSIQSQNIPNMQNSSTNYSIFILIFIIIIALAGGIIFKKLRNKKVSIKSGNSK